MQRQVKMRYETPRCPKAFGLFPTNCYETQRRYPHELYSIPYGSTQATGCNLGTPNLNCGEKSQCEHFLLNWNRSGGGQAYPTYNESIVSASNLRCPLGYHEYNGRCKYLGLDLIRTLRNTPTGPQTLLNYSVSPPGQYSATNAELAAAQYVISRSGDCVQITYP